jgi:hypothetical protein
MEKKVTKSTLLRAIDKEKQRELCEFFNINEKSLRKTLMQTDDGVTKINLLKMTFDEPSEWQNTYNLISSFVDNYSYNTNDEFIDIIKSIYTSVTNTDKFKKYKPSIKNDARLLFEKSCISGIIYDMNKTTEQSQRNFYAQLIYSHCDLLLRDIDML